MAVQSNAGEADFLTSTANEMAIGVWAVISCELALFSSGPAFFPQSDPAGL